MKLVLILIAILLSMSALIGLGPQIDQPITTQIIKVPGSSVVIRLNGNSTYQISFDNGNTLSRELQQRLQIKLRYQEFDPLKDTIRSVPDVLSAGDNNEIYIVQFVTQPLEIFRQQIRQAGGTDYFYVPNQALIVRMADSAIQVVSDLPYVRWVGPYHPAYKLEEVLLANIVSGETNEKLRYSIMLQDKTRIAKDAVIRQINLVGGDFHLNIEKGFRIEASLTNSQLIEISKLPEVLFIDRVSAPEEDMDLARIIGGAKHLESIEGYSGSGVRAEVMDSGLRTTHVDFVGSPPIIHGNNTSDTFHGTSVYGIVFGDGTGDSIGRGMLPDAQGIFSSYCSIWDSSHQTTPAMCTGLYVSDIYTHIGELVDPMGAYRAVFQTNSWGYAQTTQYSTISAELDDALFQNDILVLNSQSNTGSQNSRPQAWAKNVLSIGGSYHENTLELDDDHWSGPTKASIGPASDNRIKPDLSHFYDKTWTTSSGSDTSYSNFGGTSGATPITAGHVGLLFEMYADGVFSGSPGTGADVFNNRSHMTTAKALLINTANQYPFSGTGHDLTRTHQGWGRASVGKLYEIARENSWTLPLLIDEIQIIEPLATHTFTVDVAGTTSENKCLKVTLVYADPQGNPASTEHRVNDLSLRVTSPSGTIFWGNNGLLTTNWSASGGVSNSVDTVENVFVQSAEFGTWIVEVLADELIQDSHLETADLDADYSLVATICDPDVWVHDTPYNYTGFADTGFEIDSNMDGQSMWLSRSIWVRNNVGSPGPIGNFLDHQNPEFGQTNEIYIEVSNRGEVTANNTTVQAYWANASTGLAWGTGDWTLAGSATISSLDPGESQIVTIHWDPPEPTLSGGHICLVARLVNSQDAMTFTEMSDINFNARHNNNIGWRNVTVVDLTDSAENAFGFYIRNIDKNTNVVNLMIEDVQGFLTTGGQLAIDLGQLTQKWLQSGAKGENIELAGRSLIKLVGSPATVADIPLTYLEEYPVTLQIIASGLSQFPRLRDIFVVNVVQTSEGREHGGVSYFLRRDEFGKDSEIGLTWEFLNGERDEIRTVETNLGNLVADVLRIYGRAEIGLVNSGSIRSSHVAGTITTASVFSVLPNRERIVTLQVKGKKIREALENGVSRVEDLDGRFLQVSGLQFAYNPTLQPGSRIVNVLVDGIPLQDEQVYSVATTDAIAAGQQGYETLTEVLDSRKADYTLTEALIDYIRQASTIAPKLWNRIMITEHSDDS